MAKRFSGTHRHKVEARGRVSLPSLFRKVLGAVASEEVYVLPGFRRPDAHLCFSVAGFEAYCDKVEAAIDDPAELDAFMEEFNSRAHALPVDDAGRIVLPRELREPLEIDKDVVFVGLGNVFEIRAPEAHDARAAETGQRARPVIDRVPMSGLHG